VAAEVAADVAADVAIDDSPKAGYRLGIDPTASVDVCRQPAVSDCGRRRPTRLIGSGANHTTND